MYVLGIFRAGTGRAPTHLGLRCASLVLDWQDEVEVTQLTLGELPTQRRQNCNQAQIQGFERDDGGSTKSVVIVEGYAGLSAWVGKLALLLVHQLNHAFRDLPWPQHGNRSTPARHLSQRTLPRPSCLCRGRIPCLVTRRRCAI